MSRTALEAPHHGRWRRFELNVGGVSLTSRAVFAKHLAVMLKSGLTITEALSTAQATSSGKLHRVIGKLRRSVEAGRSFSSSLADHPEVFSGLFVNATYAGEMSGTLAESLENVAEQLSKEKELVAKIRGAMLYPTVVLAAAVALGLTLSFTVLPKITPLFEGLKVDLPPTTRGLIWFSRFMERHAGRVPVVLVALALALMWLVRQRFAKPLVHWLLLHLPLIGPLTRQANLARFCRTLGMLLKSGVAVDEALEVTGAAMGNEYYRRALVRVSREVNRGAKLADNLAQFPGLFPPLVTRMITVGEEAGRFEETLFYLASFYEAEVDTSTKSLATAVEPLLLIIIGGVVAFLALAIITPIYDITGSLQR